MWLLIIGIGHIILVSITMPWIGMFLYYWWIERANGLTLKMTAYVGATTLNELWSVSLLVYRIITEDIFALLGLSTWVDFLYNEFTIFIVIRAIAIWLWILASVVLRKGWIEEIDKEKDNDSETDNRSHTRSSAELSSSKS